MLSADNLFAMTAVLMLGAVFSFWAENQRWGRQVSGPVWAVAFGLVTPGLLVGVLGYVIANFLGVAVTGFLQ